MQPIQPTPHGGADCSRRIDESAGILLPLGAPVQSRQALKYHVEPCGGAYQQVGKESERAHHNPLSKLGHPKIQNFPQTILPLRALQVRGIG